eukprot:GHUV01046217.1.p2 GENE.GHUV01046217.1~~GHUV01046217.1.p2  ORF type:complete len:103 (-),score=10.27 GHUV01046217.1:65-373(-)
MSSLLLVSLAVLQRTTAAAQCSHDYVGVLDAPVPAVRFLHASSVPWWSVPSPNASYSTYCTYNCCDPDILLYSMPPWNSAHSLAVLLTVLLTVSLPLQAGCC